MLDLKDVRKDYVIDRGETFQTLKGISLSFPDVQFVAILGPSGCGKTTLLNLIGTLDTPTSGEILYQGRPLSALKPKERDAYRNHHVGFVFQDSPMIETMTVLDNVSLALRMGGMTSALAEKRSRDALEKVGLLSQAKKRPKQLSGGQRQRVAIARAIVTSPDILLADEPTGALDSRTSVEIMELLKTISKERLVIMVSHNETLSLQYSDRQIHMSDGLIVGDTLTVMKDQMALPTSDTPSKLSFFAASKMSLKHIWNKKWKSILTGVANSFGMIGISFFLALNKGFGDYSGRVSRESASSLPVVVTAYSANTANESRKDTNASTLYPSTDEIYPYVSTGSSTSYTYNNFTTKYFNYLDKLKSEGIVRDYLESYGSDFAYNLMTHYPDSLDGEAQGGYRKVTTSLSSYNSYAAMAGLPYNIFHVLYGNMDQYDVLAGSLPAEDTDLVLVVDRYNCVSFDILKALGFYNSRDTQDDVKDNTNENHVRPISFADIIGKEYKVFSNEDFYTRKAIYNLQDSLGHTRKVSTYYQNTDGNASFYEIKGTTLRISGIVRAKPTSSFAMLSPSLCFTPQLQASFADDNTMSSLAQDVRKDYLLKDPNGNNTPIEDLSAEIQAALDDSEKSLGDVIPREKINTILTKYFTFYAPIESRNSDISTHPGYVYTTDTGFLGFTRSIGCELIPEELYGIDLTDKETLSRYLDDAYDAFIKAGMDSKAYEDAYDKMLGLMAYLNAYALVQEVVIFPVDLETRTELMARLDSFNEISSVESPDHASNANQVVNYVQESGNAMVEEVGDVIKIVSIILIMFAVVSLTVSCAMTALLTSNNVLERRRDIGLLRAIGARKKDIAVLFEVEAFILGVLAGLLGSLLTFVLSYPINTMMNTYYPDYHVGNICSFTGWHMLIVMGVAILIGLISALIPSLKASREDPVSCLHSD